MGTSRAYPGAQNLAKLHDELPTRPVTMSAAGVGALKILVLHDDGSQIHAIPDKDCFTVGRGSSCDIVIEHDSLSRQHAQFHIVGRTVQLEDLGSMNGSWLHDLRLPANQRVPLAPGSAALLGQVVVMLHEAAVVDRLDTASSVAPTGPSKGPASAAIVRDEAMQELHDQLSQVARGPISVLLHGETGVGKEVTARRVHELSPRADGPYVTINCPAFPESLIESELFGHEKGAFTGAQGAKVGLLQSANGGTVFLDEVGELPLSMQAKLLRVLEECKVRRIGSQEAIELDVRFVAATNRNLEQEVAAGRFRRDLYFRLNGAAITIPPLRKRQSEIEPLALHFIARYSELLGAGAPPQLSEESLRALRSHSWPGNIRELRNVVERAVLLCTSGRIEPRHLQLNDDEAPAEPTSDAPATTSEVVADTMLNPPDSQDVTQQLAARPAAATPLAGTIAELEKEQILAALEACAGNQTRAAEMLGISRRQLGTRLDKHGIPRPRKR